MRPHGRARVSARNPRAFAICDRCGFLMNHDRLQWQYDWAGASLINKRILVCNTCLDVPQQQLRAIVIPADPVPIQNPRIQDYVTAETNYRTTNVIRTNIPRWVNNSSVSCKWKNNLNQVIYWSGVYNDVPYQINFQTGIPVPAGDTRITQNSNTRVTQQTGEPPGGLNQLPGTDWNAPAVIYNGTEIGLPYNNTSVPYTGPLYPPYNYGVQWNNQWNFGILTGSYWTNNVGAFVNWTTTTL